MMHVHQKHVLVVAQPNQTPADQRSCRKIKIFDSFFPDQPVQLVSIVGVLAQVVLEQMEVTCSKSLNRLSTVAVLRGVASESV